ncbi:hypothetical protein CSAL01_04085 [Colletotrichum salicis]|uniref:Uncharacterized protein n=1 Tax=Colletotrichum salicis TaxID=1209931 RepID=A0A135U5G6_9PEZI|nr:hypothetical protein CSAL01_04085 [Colletotrichum salicis]
MSYLYTRQFPSESARNKSARRSPSCEMAHVKISPKRKPPHTSYLAIWELKKSTPPNPHLDIGKNSPPVLFQNGTLSNTTSFLLSSKLTPSTFPFLPQSQAPFHDPPNYAIRSEANTVRLKSYAIPTMPMSSISVKI